MLPVASNPRKKRSPFIHYNAVVHLQNEPSILRIFLGKTLRGAGGFAICGAYGKRPASIGGETKGCSSFETRNFGSRDGRRRSSDGGGGSHPYHGAGGAQGYCRQRRQRRGRGRPGGQGQGREGQGRGRGRRCQGEGRLSGRSSRGRRWRRGSQGRVPGA